MQVNPQYQVSPAQVDEVYLHSTYLCGAHFTKFIQVYLNSSRSQNHPANNYGVAHQVVKGLNLLAYQSLTFVLDVTPARERTAHGRCHY